MSTINQLLLNTSRRTNNEVSFGWNVFDHAAYSPDLAPSNFHTFPGLRDFLGGQWFHDEKCLKKVVTNFFTRKHPAWYAVGINKVIARYKKYLTRYGD